MKAPTESEISRHRNLIMSPMHAARLKAGQRESQAGDYDHLVDRSYGSVAQRDARHRLEDQRIKKELGI